MTMRRIALYSHDAQGLGHMRRNTAVARVLAEAQPSSILMLAGAREAASFPLPPGTDIMALPALCKGADGAYRSRTLGLGLDEIVRLRGEILRSALVAFAPDVLIVDKLPSGVQSELAPSLAALRRVGTRLVLGLREVLDEPDAVRRDWERADTLRVVRAHYDEIWVYGDPRVYDPVAEYEMPADLAAMVRYTGYIDGQAAGRATTTQAADRRAELGLPDGPLSVCLVGGGEDGHRLADAFARAELPAGLTGVVVTGPFMPADQHAALAQIAAQRDDLRVLGFVRAADALIGLADQVVAMGGYNTSCEILACRKRALIVPRVRPRREQLIRAQRLAELGAVDLLAPHLLTPAALSAWLAAGPRAPDELAVPIDLQGLRRLPGLMDDLLDHSASAGLTLLPGGVPC